MRLYSGSPLQACFRFEGIDVALAGIRSMTVSSDKDRTPNYELINLYRLLEDMRPLLPLGITFQIEDPVADLPLIHGNYQLIRRSFLNLMSDAKGMISVRAHRTHAGRLLPEEHVLVQFWETGCDKEESNQSEIALKGQFLFPCTSPGNAEDSSTMVECN